MEIQTENGPVYELPEEYGRVVAFQLEQESSILGDARDAYKRKGYEVDSDRIIPFNKCSADAHL